MNRGAYKSSFLDILEVKEMCEMFILDFMKKLNFIHLFILSIFLLMITILIRNLLRNIDINKHPITLIILGIVG